tara:strand:+ start:816 stop:1700 length:885 start_codon:yes stop_codon:yes gene_type:complete
MANKADLPLSEDASTRFVPWIVGVLAYLVALALAATLILSNIAAEWSVGLEDTLTIQVPTPDDATTEQNDRRLLTAVRVLLATPGIESARPIPLDEIAEMLEPWLGAGAYSDELPLPRVIDVKLMENTEVDIDTLSIALRKAVPGASVEDHVTWRNTLILLFRALEIVAIVIIFLIGTVALAAVLFTTRFILAVHHEIVELLHLIGAHDNYIADQFQKHAFRVALKGGFGGTACALATLFTIFFLTRDLDASLLPNAGLKWWHWLVLAALPIAESYSAMLTARITIMRILKRSF